MADTSDARLKEALLEDQLSLPDEATIAALAALHGDVMILGAGGKMGPTVARMARRAITDASRRVIAVSRFGDASVVARLREAGVETIQADLSDPRAVAALPFTQNVVWMAGQKFGTAGDPVGTWTQNVVASVHAAERFAGARIVCFSTGNVYGSSVIADGGSRESDALHPEGEYAVSCMGRERVFTSITRRTGSPLLLYRLFYACDLRYGVVTDVALKVLSGTPIDLTTSHVNVIWQGDANRLALRALAQASAPAVALNVTGPIVTVREIAECVGRAAGVAPVFVADAGADTGVVAGLEVGRRALVANVDALSAAMPYVAMPFETLCGWAVEWIRADGRLLNKPTQFEVRDGTF
jgi:nucleoside-diphosphate-sugar epimerase